MNKLTILSSALLLLTIAALLEGCDSGPDNTPLPKGQVPEWQKKNMESDKHPHDPNLPPGEK